MKKAGEVGRDGVRVNVIFSHSEERFLDRHSAVWLLSLSQLHTMPAQLIAALLAFEDEVSQNQSTVNLPGVWL